MGGSAFKVVAHSRAALTTSDENVAGQRTLDGRRHRFLRRPASMGSCLFSE